MFWGNSFIFDNIPSEIYDLRLFDYDPPSPATSPSGGKVSIMEEWLYRRQVPYFFGTYYQESLEFDFVVGSYQPISGTTRHAIRKWLLGKQNYIPLRVVQDDMTDIVYNVILTEAPGGFVGNLNYTLSVHAKCDRPWGLYYPPIFTKVYGGGLTTDSFTFLNQSAFGGYNKPVTTFTMDSNGGNFSITNASDNNRQFIFTGLSANETITVDNDKGIITSSTGNLRITNFNKNFFRLVQGVNELTISGNITNFTMTCIFPRGIGA